MHAYASAHCPARGLPSAMASDWSQSVTLARGRHAANGPINRLLGASLVVLHVHTFDTVLLLL